MSQPTVVRGSKMLVLIGNGASPEVFEAPCAFGEKSFNRTTNVNDFNVPDCDDPDAPAWVNRIKSSWSGTISGSGLLPEEFIDLWEAFYADPDPRNVQVTIDYTAGARTFQGAYILTSLGYGANADGFVTVDVEMQSTGAIEYLGAP